MNHFISLNEAVDLTYRYRENREEILDSNYKNQNILPLQETFDRSPFDTVLSQPGCTGLRIYYGMNENYQVHAVIVGINENNEDLVSESSSETQNEIIEKGNRCPDICAEESPLNT